MVISLDQLTKTFGTQTAVNSLSLEIPAGQIVGFLGPNGAGRGVPLSLPTDAAKSAGRGLTMIVVMAITFGLAEVAALAWTQGWFWWLVLGEAIVAVCLYCGMRLSLSKTPWPNSE